MRPFAASAWLLRCATKRDPPTDCPRLPLPHAAAIPCALWVVNQLNDKLGSIFALIAIVIIGVVHVQLSDDGEHPLIGVPCTPVSLLSRHPIPHTDFGPSSLLYRAEPTTLRARATGTGGAHLFDSSEPEDPADAAADAEAEAAGFGKAAEVVGNSEL